MVSPLNGPLRILKNLSLSGVTPDMDARRAKRIVLSNQISISIALLNLPYVILYQCLGSDMMGWLEIPLMVGYASIHRFNAWGWTSFSRLFLVVLADLDVTIYSVSLGRETSMQLLLLLACWTPLALFDWSEKKSMIFSMGLSSALLLACEVWSPAHGLISPLQPGAERLLHLITISMLVAVQLLFAVYFLMANRRSERALESAVQAADNADRAKSRFLARINGEIAVPLAALRSAAKMSARSDGTPEQMEIIQDIETSAEDLSLLVGEILDMSRIDSGKMRLHISSDIEVLPLINGLLRPFEIDAANKGIRFRLETAPDFQATARGDATRLKQVLRNLINNAIKFTEKGEVTLKLRRGEPGMLLFEVEDTGAGIGDQDTDRIFEPFYQGDHAESRRHRGTGLGLYISRELVELMGGRIGFRARPDQGTVFHFTVPSADAR